YYRLAPVGYDLTEGTWAQAGPVTPSDLPPAPPRGLTAEKEEDQLTLEWDPSRETDLAGYNVYRAAYGQSFVKINASPLPGPTWVETLPRDSFFQYRVTAVDQAGHESPSGQKVEAAGRRADMQHIVGVLQSPGGYISGGGSYTYGSSVSLTAQANPGYYFDHWTGEIDGNANPYQFSVTDDLFVSALFSLTPLPGTFPAPTLAGSGSSGFQDGSGTGASFNFPNGVAVDTTGNIYVADTYNYRIRKITPGGVVTTLAGSGSPGSQDGNGAAASFRVPTALAVDAGGYVYVTDTENHRIRKISPLGQVTTLAGSAQGCSDGQGPAASFFFPIGIAVDGAGNVYVADTFCRMIRKITPGGQVSTVKEGYNIVSFNQPRGIAVTTAGDLIFVADTENHQIKKLTPAGSVTLLAGSGAPGSQDGTGSSASFNFPRGLARDSLGNIYVADQNNHRVRKITPAGVVTTIAGSVAGFQEGGTAMFDTPASTAVDSLLNVYVADSNNHAIRKIVTEGMSVLIPSSGNSLTFQTSTITTTLNFQPGSVGEETTVYFRPGLSGLANAQPLGASLVSLMEFNLSAITGGGTLVNPLQAPYTITIHYSDWDVREMDEASLVIYRREGGVWVPLASIVDPGNNTVTAQTTWLGDFKVSGLMENHLLFLPLILR
ncbi:MAG: hypothetical protein MUF69_09340, partial [Desulfobacterota bacterium]|nr:hypothetical protein [Thermodesulfobacteriota bacterium]